MRFSTAIVALGSASAVVAFPSVAARDDYEWKAPSATDRRSPCPMVNALANHGYLPRDGLDVSMDDLITGFAAAVNLAPDATKLVGSKALTTSTTGNSSTFNLDDIDIHGVIEHDGSLSRNDKYFGDNHSFNKTIWDSVAAHFTETSITIDVAAQARKDRLAAAKAANPEFDMNLSAHEFSMIETALYLRIFGQGTDGYADSTWVRTLFQEERLPIEEGWTRSSSEVTTLEVLLLAGKVALATIF
ncbi:hypothetical protein TD95_001789 [Thielaviopsis punctulata]|uniref:Heme haloperoxidase family profile domain-containing protein n=1 Tax=Thielaviopsis punctulata TaxID=72032 RepID=A0A0F4ZLT1_9PEZI|nr:hypothetical protein TD95_001789 [Thielaviopsis punctulata]